MDSNGEILVERSYNGHYGYQPLVRPPLIFAIQFNTGGYTPLVHSVFLHWSSYLKDLPNMLDTLEGGTPAAGAWILSVSYQNLTALQDTFMRIVFSPTGQVDTTLTSPADLNASNSILAPTIQEITLAANAAKVPDFDFWQLINWIFVSHYWALLADFGQVAPATFTYNTTTGQVENYTPVVYPATNNIFVNDTLFEAYYHYLQTTILPLFNAVLPKFNPLSETNQLTDSNVSLKLLYYCTDLQLKSSQNLIVSVIVADWALITSVFAVVLFVGAWYEQLHRTDGSYCFLIVLIVRQIL